MMAWTPYLQLVRAPALFTAVSNITAAHLLATGGVIQWPALLLLCAASVAFLSGGMVLNDCFDIGVDARERPGRPLPSGQVSRSVAWGLGTGLLVSGVAIASLVNTAAASFAAALAASVLVYDGLLKATWIGPVAMGLCRYLNWMLGLSVAALGVAAWLIPLPVLLYIAAVTVLSRAEARAQDRGLVVLAALGMLFAGATIALLWLQGIMVNIWVLPIAAAALLAVLYLLAETYREFSPQRVQSAVGRLIFGIIPLDALLVVGAGIWWGVLLVLLMLPGRWLGRRLYVT